MGLSYDLISEFVKITNDKKENTKEGTVYATVVSGTDGKYVRIDGSDLLTPMDTTTDIEDGERVTLMIKDHKAIVTGNVTTPSASTTKVDKVAESVNSVSDRVGTFELVVADKVSTNELEAYKATIEVLIANKATIEDLTATNAKIENLEVKNAQIENLVAEKATITDLEAVNATIENLKVKDAEIENAVVENLKATTADIKILNADFAQIKTLVNGNLTSDNILSFNLTSGKVTVDDAFIKDAMIDTVNAAKINAGRINTSSVSIGSEDGGMIITGSTQQFTDKNGNVRIQIGKDASGDFTFVLYGEDGKGQLINQNGITASAISDGLIVNDMVSDHAAISGGKLDISSVITEINSDNSTTIKSSKIYLNEQAQSLEVAFNSLKTKVDTIQEVTIQGDLTAIVEQVQSNTSKIEANKNSINTLISQDTVIKKQVTDLQGTLNETETTLNSKYTSLSQNLNGFKTTVADTYATKKSVTDVVDNISANYSTTSVMNSAIKQKAQEISASVSSTYATKNQVSTLDNNLKTNYSTTKQMESAINIAKEAINLGVSTNYETKENTTSKIQNALNNIQVGGTNLWVLLDLKTGYESNGNIIGSTAPHKTRQTLIPTNGSRQLVYQCWNPNKVINSSNGNRVAFFDSSKAYISSTKVLQLNGQTYQWQIIDIPTNAVYMRLGAICGSEDKYDTTIKIKFELGNKPTDYSLAPEDVTNDISTAKTEAITSANNTLTSTISNYYTKSQTDSQINVAKEAINLGVSTTYETKTNVQTKVTSTLNSAKSYADTKKSEAISTAATDATSKANTAKQEAIRSANNTLSSTISNYYTKSQTDSQINVAKEAINLGVSSIYETKTNVDSKINAIQVGGRNLIKNSNKRLNSKTPTSVQLGGVVDYQKLKGKTITLSMDINVSGMTNASGERNRVGFEFAMTHSDGTATHIGIWHYVSDGNYNGRKAKTFAVPNKDIKSLGYNGLYMQCNATSCDMGNVKLEEGNKATSWSPAPEDISADISTAKKEAISSANNTLSSTISNYYTKSQTDSQIKVAKEAINLSVSNTYETKTNVESKIKDISVGGTNLAFDTNKGITGWGWSMQTNGGKTITEYLADGINGVKMTKDANNASGWNYVSYNSFKRNKITPATTYVVSFEMKSNKTFNVGSVELKQGDSANTLLKSITTVQNKVTANSTAWSKIIFRLVTLDTLPSSTSQVIYITGIPCTANATHYFRNLKLEAGNTPTAWSPAPEDINTSINNAKSEAITSANNTLKSTIANYYTKTQTDSQINVAKEAINLGVSTTYETKTNVQTKVTSTLNSAKSYADTKINNISIGSVNLLTGTSKPYSMNINKPTAYNTYDPYFTPDKQTLSQLGFKEGDQVTVGFNWKISKNGSTDFVYGNFRAEFVGADGTYKGNVKNPVATFSASNTKGRSEATVTLSETSVSAVGLRIRIDKSVLTLTISDVKMEKGNKATSWSPAPEDIESDITTIESETKSLKQTVSSLALGADSISASVKSLEESMVNTTNGLASDISKVQEQVNLAMTSSDVKLEIQKELANGVKKVSTSTGFTFDDKGLTINKSDSEMNTQITEDGMKIYKNNEVMLTANNQGVDAKNLHATTYLIIGGNSRMEDFTEDGNKRTAVFWIG